MTSLVNQAESVESREDLAAFIDALRSDLRSSAAQWPNDSLDSYLDGMSGWVGDLHGVFMNRSEPVPDQPSWNLVAQILMAALVYE